MGGCCSPKICRTWVGRTCHKRSKIGLAQNRINLDQARAIVVRVGNEEFLENLNVVVTNQEIVAGDATILELKKGLPQQYVAIGIKLENMQGRVQKFGNHEVIVLDYTAHMPSVPFPLQQRQAYFPGGGKTYIVTCTGRADNFKFAPVFDAMLASLQVPPPKPGGFDWKQVGGMTLAGGVAGAVIGLAIGLLNKFGLLKKAQRVSKNKAE